MLAEMNRLIRAGLPQHLAMAVLQGAMSENEASEEFTRNHRARQLASMRPEKWPEIDIEWDVSPQHFHLALDGVGPAEFKELFPEVKIVGVDTEELHGKLAPASQRAKDPF